MFENGFRIGVWTGIVMGLDQEFHTDCDWVWIEISVRIRWDWIGFGLEFRSNGVRVGIGLDCVFRHWVGYRGWDAVGFRVGELSWD